MAGGDPAAYSGGRTCRSAGTCPETGASRSSTPRSASRIAAVAVTVFVIENHGHTMPAEAGTWAAISARPAAPPARTPSGPATSTSTPGTPSPASARIRSPAITPATATSPYPIRTCCGQSPARSAACTELTQRRAGTPAASRAGANAVQPSQPSWLPNSPSQERAPVRQDLASGSRAVHSQHRRPPHPVATPRPFTPHPDDSQHRGYASRDGTALSDGESQGERAPSRLIAPFSLGRHGSPCRTRTVVRWCCRCRAPGAWTCPGWMAGFRGPMSRRERLGPSRCHRRR
jgi:hypothetical protein